MKVYEFKALCVIVLLTAICIAGMASDPNLNGKKTGHRLGNRRDKSFVEKVQPKGSATPTPAPYYPYYSF